MADTFLALLQKQRPDIEKLLASWITPERFFAMAMQIEKNPELRGCTPESLVEAVIMAAQMGLEIGGVRGHIYVIKYGNLAQAQPGWRGLAFLRLRAGAIMQLDTEVVFKGETFRISRSNADGDLFLHEIDMFGDRTEKNAVGAYARVKLADGEQQFEAVSAERIQRHRQHSKQPNGLLWTKFWEEGWRKTPYRILDKRLPEGVNAEAIERYNVARSIETTSYRIDPDAAPDDLPTLKSVEVPHAGSESARSLNSPQGTAARAGAGEAPLLQWARALIDVHPKANVDRLVTEQEQIRILNACRKAGIKSGVIVTSLCQATNNEIENIEDLPVSLLPGFIERLMDLPEVQADVEHFG